jgi:uncharacterized protein (DUF433 family)
MLKMPLAMPRTRPVSHSDSEILGGAPVFVGTRVPVQLIDYIEAGDSLDTFIEDFPTVKRSEAVEVLELARSSRIESLRPLVPAILHTLDTISKGERVRLGS